MKLKIQNELKIETNLDKLAKSVKGDKIFSDMYYIIHIILLIGTMVTLYMESYIACGAFFILSTAYVLRGDHFLTHKRLIENRILILQRK